MVPALWNIFPPELKLGALAGITLKVVDELRGTSTPYFPVHPIPFFFIV